jgi:hypothetical protein
MVASRKPHAWTETELRAFLSLSDQAAIAVENARLLEATQRRADRERWVAEITTRVRASTQVDTILRSSILELGRTLRASEGLIQLDTGDGATSPAKAASPSNWNRD